MKTTLNAIALMTSACALGLASLALAADAKPAAKPGAQAGMQHDMAAMSSAKPAAAAKSDDAQLIASARRAAPPNVAKGAAVMAAEADGKMRMLKAGTNGFTCIPDNPATPGPDPMCVDKNALAWMNALLGHQKPPAGKVGLMYMLEGGTDASNTDPYAAKPEPGNHWIKTGPHVMIVGGDASFYDQYPKSPDPDTSQPYVMYAGTPYLHLMVPIK
jgi:hypothetical protein